MAESTESVKLREEVISLISLAKSKNIDVSVWLAEESGEGLSVVSDFNAKLKSLSLVVAFGEDDVNKSILDAAACDDSLQSIHDLCGAGEDSNGLPVIDVRYFLRLCGHLPSAAARSSNYELSDAAELHSLGVDTMRFGAFEGGVDAYSAEYFNELKDANMWRPETSAGRSRGTFPAGDDEHPTADRGGASRLDLTSVSQTDIITSTDQQTNQPSRRPSSALGSARSGISVNNKGKPTAQSSLEPAIKARTKAPANAADSVSDSSSSVRPRPRPASADPFQRNKNLLQTPQGAGRGRSCVRVSTSARSSRGLKIDDISISSPIGASSLASHMAPLASLSPHRLCPAPSASVSVSASSIARARAKAHNSTPSTAALLVDLHVREQRDIVEDHIRNAVRQTDLYHLIQVHLGFVDPGYTMVPPRGVIVSCNPREWLTSRDIQTAFLAGRVRLNDMQVMALSELVHHYSKEYMKAHKSIPISDTPGLRDGNLENKSSDANAEDTATEEEKKNEHEHDGPTTAGLEPKTSQSNALLSRAAAQQTPVAPLPKHAVAPGPKFNSEWMKLYLVHLRITCRSLGSSRSGPVGASTTVLPTQSMSRRRSLSASKSQDPSTARSGHDGDCEEGEWGLRASQTFPMPWLDWLGSKLADDRNISENKSRSFRKALAGKPHTLSKEEMNRILEAHEIIPEALMEAEIAHRVKGWVLDTSGRRDFSHNLNVKMREWEVRRIKELKEAAALSSAKASSKISSNERERVRAAIKRELIDAKTAELRASERTHAVITKDLYWKYDAAMREDGYRNSVTWGQWLNNHRDASKKQLDKFVEFSRVRVKACAERIARKNFVASLSDIETKLLEISNYTKLKSFGLELRKSLVQLRKAAVDRSVGMPMRAALVSKEEFDQYLADVLAPRVKDLPEDIKAIVKDIHRTYTELLEKQGLAEPRGQSGPAQPPAVVMPSVPSDKDMNAAEGNEIFQSDRETVERRVLEQTDKKSALVKAKFVEWEEAKIQQIKADEEKKKLQDATEKHEREKKRKAAKKAYRKWLRLHAHNKYISKVDGKKHIIPKDERVKHYSPWNNEVDLKDFYAEMDRRFY